MQAAVAWTAPPHPRLNAKSNSVLGRAQSLALSPSAKSKRRSSSSSLYCGCASSSNSVDLSSSCSSQYEEWDWARWSQHFSEIDQAESYVSVLKFQLEEAIEKEDFLEATKLQKSISEASTKDVVGQVLSELKNAIEEQRYQDASRLSRHAGTGLIGWWVGRAKDTDDSLGRIVKITPELGRYVAKSYSPRQLMIESAGKAVIEMGKPLFEIFLLKNDNGSYTSKVVSFKSINESKPATKQDPEENNSSTEKDKKPSEDRENTIKDLLGLLKQKMPAFNAQVIKSNVDSVQQLMHEQDEKEEDEKDDKEGKEEENVSTDLDADEKVKEEDEDFNKTKFLNKMKHLMHAPDQEDQDSTDTDLDAEEKETDELSKLFLGGVIHAKDELSSLTYKRVPADLSQMEKDSFLLHIPQNLPNSSEERDSFIQAASDLMPSDVAHTLLNKPGSKRRKEREAMQGAMSGLVLSELQHRFMNKLSKETLFNRIPTDSDNLDPFTGLYVGSFGPYGPEVVHLRRRFGHWADGDDDNNNDGELEFFEYVEAVKLTGDFNVPAGQVTFRARIGNRVQNDYGMFPDSFGVKAFYHGQGRIAKRGYKNPEWVEGELLELTGKGMGPIRGAKLGFLYFVPKRNFLVLFNRLNLPQ